MQLHDARAELNSPGFWKQPYRVPASSDPDTATAQTVEIMCGHIKDAAGDALVKQTADQAVQQFSNIGLAGPDETAAIANACWWWCKLYINFVHHEFIIRQRLGEAGHLQGLISPEILVAMDKPEGDCAIFTECLCSFLRVFGVPYEIVTVAVNPNEPDVFSHVYLYAVLMDGSRLPLDASHGDYPGWQVPSAHVSRRQVWNADGNPVADQGSRFDGLHNYGLRGLGDSEVYDPLDPYVPIDSGGYSNPTQTFGNVGYQGNWSVADSGAPYSGPAYQAPSQSSAQWATFATNLAKMGFTLAQINAIQPGTVVSANGAILRQNPGYSVPIGSQISSALGGGNTLLYVGIGAALLIGVSMMGGRR